MRGRGLRAAAAIGFLIAIPEFRSVEGFVFIVGITAAILFAAAVRTSRRR
ncbi:hypothetical protein [Micromonospora sp. RV43]|nr:hypothetical protein [Micromonospora sp. RV43]